MNATGFGGAPAPRDARRAELESLRAFVRTIQIGGPNPDALQDVPLRERGATGLIPERPEEMTVTSVRGRQ